MTTAGFDGRSPQSGAGVGYSIPPVGGRWQDRRHFVLFPLVWHFGDDKRDESTTVVATFLHRRRGGETTDALFPLVYYRRGARPGGSEETSFTLFPLVHYRKDAFTRLLLTPLAGSVTGPRRAGGFVGPYLWYRGPTLSAAGIPFLYADITRVETGERTRQFGPLFTITARIMARWSFCRSSAATTTPGTGTTYFPRTSAAQGGCVRRRHLSALFWRSIWRDRTTRRRIWYTAGSDVHNTGLVPFYFWRRTRPARCCSYRPSDVSSPRLKADTSVTWAGSSIVLTTEARRHGGLSLCGPAATGNGAKGAWPFYWHFEDGKRAVRGRC